LAVTCFSDVAVLPGKGDGTFGPPIYSTTGGNAAVFLAAGDFNGDGKLDLAVSGVSESGYFILWVLLGLGDGTFVLQAQYQEENSLTVPAVADVNGDGKLDLLVPEYIAYGGTSYVAVLLGNGDGTFQPGVDYGTATAPSSLWLADVSGDGKLDLAVVTSSGCTQQPIAEFCGQQPGPGTISVLLGFGDGTFVGPNDYPTDQPGGGNAVASADFNNDGKLDLATANTSNSVSVLLGKGNGTFQTPVSYPAGQYPLSLAAGDLRNNGNVDLVTVNVNYCNSSITPCGPGTVSVLLGNGDGTFQAHTDYGVGLLPSSVAVGDFRSNGKLDIAVVNNASSSVSILLGNGDGTFQPQVSYLTASLIDNQTNPQMIAIGDFNQDGKPDLAIATTAALSILLGNGDGTFQSHVDIPLAGGAGAIATADFNGDGKLDLVF
jgi:FG-GAP-like repeat